jgi:hypothetical protein
MRRPPRLTADGRSLEAVFRALTLPEAA